MRPFTSTISLDEARRRLTAAVRPIARTERVALDVAAGRVAAADITSPIDVPPFARSAMDGYAVVAADTVFTPGDVARFAKTPGHAIAVRRHPAPEPPRRSAVRIEEGRVTRVLDDDPANPLAGAPLWRLGEDFDAALLDGLGGPPYELAGAFQRLVDAGEIVGGVEIGPTRDLTHPVDIVAHNFLYSAALVSE